MKKLNINKHMTKITKCSKFRPILQGVLFDPDTNTMNVTDSYRVLRYPTNLKINDRKVIDINTLQEIDGNYPNINHLFPNHFNTTIKLNNNIINKDILKLLKSFKKNTTKLKISDCFLFLSIDELKIDITSFNIESNNTHDIYLNTNYFIDMLEFLIEYKKECNADIYLNIIDNVRAITIKPENEQFTYLIAPIRK